jgi:hypothetical protein
MQVDAAMLAHLRRVEAELPEAESSPLAALETTPMTIAWLIESFRQSGGDEVLAVELALTDLGLHRETLREDAAVLHRLGYRQVAGMMRRLERKAKPRPPKRWPGTPPRLWRPEA